MITKSGKTAIEQIHNGIKIKEKTITNGTFSEKAKNTIVRSIQIGKRALLKWGIIIEDYDKYRGNYNIKHNIMVKTQSEIVATVDKFIEDMVEKDGEFAKFIHRNEEEVFPMLLMFCSEICCKKGLPEFENILNNGNTIEKIRKMLEIKGIDELYSIDGISEDTEKRIDSFLLENISP